MPVFNKAFSLFLKPLVVGGLFLCYGLFHCLIIFFHVAELVFILETSKVQNKVESQNLLEAVFEGLVDSRKSHCLLLQQTCLKKVSMQANIAIIRRLETFFLLSFKCLVQNYRKQFKIQELRINK